jgi:hypothetical protein
MRASRIVYRLCLVLAGDPEAKTTKSSRLSCISGGISFRVKLKDMSLRLDTRLTVVACTLVRMRALEDRSLWMAAVVLASPAACFPLAIHGFPMRHA